MQHSAHSGSSRREERIPFDAAVELRGSESEVRLAADGLNVSMGGMAMRAAFVPPLGALLECRFRCPPDHELVCAHGEVIWTSAAGANDGSFGLRFVELDTKSATALRRYLTPGGAHDMPGDRLRAATLMIDGLGASVEADLKLADEQRIVLEQQLTFLQLGRGVEVEVLGRGKERGRIASVELRHTHFDVPTLVFGILLDDAPERCAEPVASSVAPLFGGPLEVVDGYEEAAVAYARELDIPLEEDGGVAASDAGMGDEPLAAALRLPHNARLREPVRASSAADDGGLGAARSMLRAAKLRWARLREQLSAGVSALSLRLESWKGRAESVAGDEGAPRLDVGTRLLLRLARLRAVVLGSGRRGATRHGARGAKPPPPLRVQRAKGAVGASQEVSAASRRRARVGAAVLAMLGVALGAYALAPRSGADRIRLPERVAGAPKQTDERPVEAGDPSEPSGAPSGLRKPPVRDEPGQQAAAPSLLFGDAEVPNGRMFVLRMNGPVASVEGEARDGGFTVRVAQRLALDRAAPIAASHPAVARAMILNRGGYAELTVDFLPGVRPRYQVVGKGDTLELTLERLQ